LTTPSSLSARRSYLPSDRFLDSLNQQEQKRPSEALVNEASAKSRSRRASLLNEHKKIIKDAFLIVEKTNDFKPESIGKEKNDQKYKNNDELEKG
jgi:hypothetical protein